MSDVLRKNLEETVGAHIAKAFDIDKPAEGVSKRILASCLFLSPFAIFLGHRVDMKIEDIK